MPQAFATFSGTSEMLLRCRADDDEDVDDETLSADDDDGGAGEA